MPELPEVEIVGRNLHRWAVGKRIVQIEPLREATFQDGSLELAVQVQGSRVMGIARRGKVLLLETDGPAAWLMRFGMTGKWVQQTGAEPPARTRVRVALEDGSPLCFVDLRNLGGIWGVASAQGRDVLARVVPGKDPILEGLDGSDLEAMFYRRNVAVKALLLEQSLVSGVGNIYASEALYRAGIHPLTPAGQLEPAACGRLARAIVEVLTWAIEAEWRDEVKYFGEAGAVNIFSVYQHAGKACGRCGVTIERVVIATRSTFFCRSCQPDPALEKVAGGNAIP